MAETPVQTLSLGPGVHAVGANGDLIFLDVGRDTYICLPEGERQTRLSRDRRSVAIADPDLAADLTRAGLVVPSARANPAASMALPAWPWPAPTRSALCDHYDLPRAGDGLQIGVALIDVLTAYRGRPFQEILDAVRRPRASAPSVSADLIRTAEDFHRWSPYAPTSAKCLLRAFMLLRFLQRRGLDAHWVFGVRTWPFHAHCWLQCEDMVLDDEPDRIRAFTPILVV